MLTVTLNHLPKIESRHLSGNLFSLPSTGQLGLASLLIFSTRLPKPRGLIKRDQDRKSGVFFILPKTVLHPICEPHPGDRKVLASVVQILEYQVGVAREITARTETLLLKSVDFNDNALKQKNLAGNPPLQARLSSKYKELLPVFAGEFAGLAQKEQEKGASANAALIAGLRNAARIYEDAYGELSGYAANWEYAGQLGKVMAMINERFYSLRGLSDFLADIAVPDAAMTTKEVVSAVASKVEAVFKPGEVISIWTGTPLEIGEELFTGMAGEFSPGELELAILRVNPDRGARHNFLIQDHSRIVIIDAAMAGSEQFGNLQGLLQRAKKVSGSGDFGDPARTAGYTQKFYLPAIRSALGSLATGSATAQRLAGDNGLTLGSVEGQLPQIKRELDAAMKGLPSYGRVPAYERNTAGEKRGLEFSPRAQFKVFGPVVDFSDIQYAGNVVALNMTDEPLSLAEAVAPHFGILLGDGIPVIENNLLVIKAPDGKVSVTDLDAAMTGIEPKLGMSVIDDNGKLGTIVDVNGDQFKIVFTALGDDAKPFAREWVEAHLVADAAMRAYVGGIILNKLDPDQRASLLFLPQNHAWLGGRTALLLLGTEVSSAELWEGRRMLGAIDLREGASIGIEDDRLFLFAASKVDIDTAAEALRNALSSDVAMTLTSAPMAMVRYEGGEALVDPFFDDQDVLRGLFIRLSGQRTILLSRADSLDGTRQRMERFLMTYSSPGEGERTAGYVMAEINGQKLSNGKVVVERQFAGFPLKAVEAVVRGEYAADSAMMGEQFPANLKMTDARRERIYTALEIGPQLKAAADAYLKGDLEGAVTAYADFARTDYWEEVPDSTKQLLDMAWMAAAFELKDEDIIRLMKEWKAYDAFPADLLRKALKKRFPYADSAPGTMKSRWDLLKRYFNNKYYTERAALPKETLVKERREFLEGIWDSNIRLLASKADHAMKETPGGIDLNAENMQLNEQGQEIDMQFDPALLEQFRSGDFTGLTPVILEMTPISNIRPLLGLAPASVGSPSADAQGVGVAVRRESEV